VSIPARERLNRGVPKFSAALWAIELDHSPLDVVA
jgi:homogentisate 1,2-dioxygenase